jgi:hypothetical protein
MDAFEMIMQDKIVNGHGSFPGIAKIPIGSQPIQNAKKK